MRKKVVAGGAFAWSQTHCMRDLWSQEQWQLVTPEAFAERLSSGGEQQHTVLAGSECRGFSPPAGGSNWLGAILEYAR